MRCCNVLLQKVVAVCCCSVSNLCSSVAIQGVSALLLGLGSFNGSLLPGKGRFCFVGLFCLEYVFCIIYFLFNEGLFRASLLLGIFSFSSVSSHRHRVCSFVGNRFV